MLTVAKDLCSHQSESCEIAYTYRIRNLYAFSYEENLSFFFYLFIICSSYFSLTSIESKNFFVISFERIEILFLSGKRIFAYISNKNFYFILFYFFFFGILKIRHVTVS